LSVSGWILKNIFDLFCFMREWYYCYLPFFFFLKQFYMDG
jgi:hypothetical protein